MSDKGTINLRGKKYVTFAGLLDRLHQHFRESGNNWEIETWIPERGIPCEENGYTAIVRATITEFCYSDEGIREIVRRTSGIGDANRGNVSQNIAPHIIRQAETRSKARAARDFLNVEGEEFEGEYQQETPRAGRGQSRASGELAVVDGGYEDDVGHQEVTELLEEIHDLTAELHDMDEEITDWLSSLVGRDASQLERVASKLRIRKFERDHEEMKGAAKSEEGGE